MEQPRGFTDPDHPNWVLRLNKAIYGLKQSGRAWNSTLNAVLEKLNFASCENELRIELPWEVGCDGDIGSISIGQKQYVQNLLRQYGMEQCKTVSTPLDCGFKINRNDDSIKMVDKTEFQSLIGALVYLAISTRPDIQHSVSKLAQCNSNPNVEHMSGAKHILKYLAKTVDFKLHYKSTGDPICGFADADWGGEPIDRKSYSGYAFLFGGGPVSWDSKKQTIVALSSTEAEYVALCNGAKEAVYLKRLIAEIGYCYNDNPMVLKCDNQSAQHLALNKVYHARTKHIDIKYHYIRSILENKLIVLVYTSTSDMIADIFTKNLTKEKHLKFIKALGIY